MKMDCKNQIVGVLFLFLLLVLGFSSTGSAFYNNYNPTIYMIYFILPFLFFYKNEIINYLNFKILSIFFIMFSLFGISSIISPIQDIYEIWWRLVGIIVCSLFGYITKILLDIKAISFTGINNCLAIIGLIHVGFLLYLWNITDNPFTYNWVENLYFFTNIRHLADLLSICYFATFFLFLINKEFVKYLYFIFSIVLLSCIFWSGSRAAYVGILMAWFVLFIHLNKKNLLIYAILFSFFTSVYVSTFFNVASPSLGFFSSLHSSAKGSVNQLSSSRLDLYHQVFDWFLLRPYWGYGGEAVRNLKIFLGTQQIGQAHNLILQILIEYGLIGLSITMIVLIVILNKTMIKNNKIKTMCLAMFFNIFGASLLNGGAYYIIIIAFFSIFVGLVYSEDSHHV